MDLLSIAIGRLQSGWRADLRVGGTLVDLPERIVFDGTVEDRRFVVKVDRSTRRGARERMVLQYVNRGGVPVPRVLFADPGPPSVLVLEHISGTPLSEDSADQSWTAAGRVLRNLHDLAPPPDLGPPRGSASWRSHMMWWADHETKPLREAGLVDAGTADRLQQCLAGALSTMDEPPRTMVHLDCQPDHWLIGGDQTRVAGLVDFGDAAIGDPVWDMAVLTLWQPSRLNLVLDGYRPTRDLVDRSHRLLCPYCVLRHLGAASWLARHGLDPGSDLAMATKPTRLER